MAGTALAALSIWMCSTAPLAAAEERSVLRGGQQLADATSVHDFAIAAQPLAAALNSFAELTGVAFAYKTDDVAGLASPGVSGRMTTSQALGQLLVGTGILHRFEDDDTVILTRAEARQDGTQTLAPILVESRAGVGDHAGAADHAGAIGVTREDLQRRNPQTVKEVFAGESEVSVGGALRSSQKVYVNGVEETNMAVSIDGARQNNKVFHHSGTNLIDPALLKGVRVDPGVAPADAGPGALGGAIVYETVDVGDLLAPDQPFGGFTTGSYDTNSGAFVNGNSAYGRAGGFEALGFLQWGLGGEYDNGAGNEVPGSETDFRSVLGKGGYETDDGQRFEVAVEYLRDRAARPFRANIGAIIGAANPDTRKYDMERRNITFNYGIPEADGLWDPKIVLGWGETEIGVPSPYGSVGTTGSFSGKAENDFNFSAFGFEDSVTFGVDFYDDRAKYEDPSDEMEEAATNVGIYAQARLQPLQPLRISFGLRGDQQWFEGVDGAELDDAGVSGNVSAAFDVTDFLTLKAGYSQVWGGIALAENFIMNPAWDYDGGIEPVRSENFVAGFDVFYEGFTFDAGVFRSDFENARAPTYGGGPGLTTDFRTQGYNLGAGYDWGSGFLRVSYTDSEIEVNGDLASSYTTQYLGAPLGRIIAVEAAHTFDEVGVTIGGTIDAALENTDTEDAGGGALPSYEVFNLFVEYQPEFAEFMSFRLEANNIFDANYADRATYGQDFDTVEPLREPGRSILFVARARF